MISLPVAGAQRDSWEGLLDVASIHPDGWTIVGGQLTYLHLVDRSFPYPRPTADLDAVIDVRGNHPTAVQDFVNAMREVGFTSPIPTPDGHQHRWVRGRAQIDILVPRGLSPNRSDGHRTGAGRVTTIATAGGQFVLDRSSAVTVNLDGRVGDVNAPDLLGALFSKCSALLNYLDINKERHFDDILMLASVTDYEQMDALAEMRLHELKRLQSGIRQALDSKSVWAGTGVVAEKASGFLHQVALQTASFESDASR